MAESPTVVAADSGKDKSGPGVSNVLNSPPSTASDIGSAKAPVSRNSSFENISSQAKNSPAKDEAPIAEGDQQNGEHGSEALVGTGEASLGATQDAPAEPSVDTDRVQDASKSEGSEDIEPVKPLSESKWPSPATLYCTRNKQPHSNLVSFGIFECPTCWQDLSPRAPSSPASSHIGDDEKREKGGRLRFGDTLEPEDVEKVVDNEKPEEHEKQKEPSTSHYVEYMDAGGNLLQLVNWDHPFDLDEERKTASHSRTVDSAKDVYEITTVLRTSIPSDPTRDSWESSRIVSDGILNKSGISVALQSVRITILSELVIDVLKSVTKYPTGDQLNQRKLTLREPYAIVGHHLEELEQELREAEPQPDATVTVVGEAVGSSQVESRKHTDSATKKDLHTHLGYTLKFFFGALRDPIAQEKERYQKEIPMCTFRMLWHLFRPGSLVYVMSEGTADAFMVESVSMDDFILSSSFEHLKTCSIKLWYLEFNGMYILRAAKDVLIRPFEGEKAIQSLKVIPCDIHDKFDNGALREELKERGKRWTTYLLGKQVDYNGEPPQPGKKPSNGRAYIDCASYYQLGNIPDFHPLDPESASDAGGALAGCSCSSCREKRASEQSPVSLTNCENIEVKDVADVSHLSHLPSHMYMLCSRELKAFMFNTRSWETIDIRYCKVLAPDHNPFDKLVLPEKTKDMIQALVFKYADPTYAGDNPEQVWGADFIKNKGEGQIFLLHGGPGVGKTFTAECIAEFTGRPLLALTCGDIGTEEVSMEKKLREWLKLAHTWGAVMLLDEADIFLEKRVDGDIKRNSLVSGILFLTSNRVGKFDDAIVSRIHVIIHYEDFNEERRATIWNLFFDKLEDEKGETMRIDRAARRYVLENDRIRNIKWNGREIRNAFQTAVALAEYRFLNTPPAKRSPNGKAVLKESDFSEICEMTIKFKTYLTKTHLGNDESMRAQAEYVRFNPELEKQLPAS